MAELATFLGIGSGGGIGVAAGGTGAVTAAAALTSLGAAASGANTDITSIAGLTTPLSPAQGGLGQVAVQSALSAAINGYVKLYNGLIIQWGFATLTNQQRNTITFPASFPTACLAMLASPASGIGLASNGVGVGASPISNAQGQIAIASASPGTTGAYWLAIGN